MKTTLCILLLSASLAVAGLWKRGDDVRELPDGSPKWAAMGYAPVQVSQVVTATVTTVTTNDLTENAVRAYLVNNKPAGVTSDSTPAQVRAAWSNAVEAATSANKPRVLSEQAVWMPAWMLYKTLPALLPYFTTNVTVTVTNVYSPRSLNP